MKKSLIIFNVIFLLIGNLLFSNIHHSLHDHEHLHFDDYQNHDCQKCIIIDNNSIYISNFYESYFLNSDYIQVVFQEFTFIENNIDKKYNSRAPPIS